MSGGEQEVSLLETVELRFALADDATKFAAQLDNFLSPVLLKLASPHQVVQNKVIAVLAHVNKRLKAQPDIQIPVRAMIQLLDINQLPIEKPSLQAHQLIVNFALIYIDMGFLRLAENEQVDLLPLLLKDLASRSASQLTTILNVFLSALEKFNLSVRKMERKESPFAFTRCMRDAEVALNTFLPVILYHPPVILKAKTVDNPSDQPKIMPIPSMSPSSIALVTNAGKAPWAKGGEPLKHIKLEIIRFIINPVFFPTSESFISKSQEDKAPKFDDALVKQNDEYIYKILLAGSCDANFEVAAACDDALKRRNKPDLESKRLVDDFFNLYLGTPQNEDEKSRRNPASTSLKAKIVHVLSKSVLAANTFPSFLQVIFDGLYGNETNVKIRLSVMTFVHWVAQRAEESVIQPVIPVLVSGMTKYIRESQELNQTPASSAVNNSEIESLRGFGYVALGLLSKKAPMIFQQDMTLLETIFSAASSETTLVRSYVQDSLSSLLSAYQNMTETDRLKEIILQNITKNEHQARYASIKYASHLFPFSDPFARFVCILASNDPKLEIKEIALSGLKAEYDRKRSDLLIDFSLMVDTFLNLSKQYQDSTLFHGKRIMNLPLTILSKGILFLRSLLFHNACPSFEVTPEVKFEGEEGSQFSDATWESDLNLKATIRQFFQKTWSSADGRLKSSLDQYVHLLRACMDVENSDASLIAISSACLRDLLIVSPLEFSQHLVTSNVDTLMDLLDQPKKETRENVSQILGICVSALAQFNSIKTIAILNELSEVFTTTQKLYKNKKVSLEYKAGCLLTTGFIFGRIQYRGFNLEAIWNEELKTKFLSTVKDTLKTSSYHLCNVAVASLAEATRYGPINLSLSKQNELVELLLGAAKDQKDVKLQEASILALSHFSFGYPEASSKVVDLFFWLAEQQNKQVDIHFVVGEATSNICGGWNAVSMARFLDLPGVVNLPQSHQTSNWMKIVLEKILDEYLIPASGSKSQVTRRAICIWLLSLVRFCQTNQELLSQLAKIHKAFSAMLSDRDETTQEIASKGIGLVYRLGDDKVKEDLVYALVGSFSDSAPKETVKVSEDTQIFDQGTFGNAPDGSSVTTYKELCSLASELNQPDLVYKFMNLASHNQMWNTRKGVAFGFSEIIDMAREELKPMLPSLIPKLYRYCFDPHPKVAESMKNIFSSLVKDQKTALDEYFETIMKDLLVGLGNRLWRTRESCCAAVADLIHGRDLNQVHPYIEELWQACFRVLDDIKESVRVAAFKTCKSLTNLSLRYCDPTTASISEGTKMMSTIVPYMLTKGLLSAADDVQKFSLSTLLIICKKSGVLLKPHVDDIIATFLEGMSSFEPQALNYLSFHVEKYQITQEQLETTRLSAAKMSPMMEAIENCIEYIDDKNLPSLIGKVCQLIRKGVGLPTKAGCARFVVSSIIKKPQFFQDDQQSSDMLLKAISGAIKDKSPVVRKSYATAAGYLCKLVSDATFEKFCTHIKGIYCNHEENELRSITAHIFSEISKHANDKFKSHQNDYLPLVFFGMHDSEKETADVWKSIWENNTGDVKTAIKMCLPELVQLVPEFLDSQSWPLKIQAALTVADFAKEMGEDLIMHMDTIYPLFVGALNGRTWPEKHTILRAFCDACVASPDYFKSDGEKMKELTKIFLREARRNNNAYKRVGIEQLGRYLDAFEQVSLYDEIKEEMLELACQDEIEKNAMDEDDVHGRPLFLLIRANAFVTLASAWPRDSDMQGKNIELLRILAENLGKLTIPWNVRSSILTSIEKCLAKIKSPKDVLTSEIVTKLFKATLTTLKEHRYSSIRESGVMLLLQKVELVQGTTLLDTETKSLLVLQLTEHVQGESIHSLADQCKKVLSLLS